MATVVTALGEEFGSAELAAAPLATLEAILVELDAKREALREQGRMVRAVLESRLKEQALLAKLAGLTPGELAAVLALAQKDPGALQSAAAVSRGRRPALEVVANAADLTAAVVGAPSE